MEHDRENIVDLQRTKGAIDRYDFKEDHGPGEEDHSDGEVLRYIEGVLKREEEVSSGLALDRENDYLYIATRQRAGPEARRPLRSARACCSQL